MREREVRPEEGEKTKEARVMGVPESNGGSASEAGSRTVT